MKKFIKIVKIILLSLLVFVLVGYVVLYIVKPVEAKQILATVVEYANKPLPIAGVSATAFAVLVWKIFSCTHYGRKNVSRAKREYEIDKEHLSQKYEADKNEYVAIISYYEEEIDLLFDALTKVCEVTPNKKVKEIGADLNGDYAKVRSELRNKFNKIASSSTEVELLLKSKKEIVESVVEELKKELVEKYGKESQEAIKYFAEAKKI